MAWKLRSKPSTAAAESAKEAPPPVNGFFRGTEQLISGWVLDVADPSRKHEVEIFVAGKHVGTARADRFDPLVQAHHGGDGNYAFAFFYDGDLTSGPAEASVKDLETATALRSKQPLVRKGSRSGPPLIIDGFSVGKKAVLRGRIGAYPWVKDMGLELWQDDKRVVSSIPITVINESEGQFAAELKGEALRVLLSEQLQIAFPGLKEAGHAVTLEKLSLRAAVSMHEGRLRVSLRGNFEQSGPVPVVVRFTPPSQTPFDCPLEMASRVGTASPPPGFELVDGSVEVLVSGAPIPTRVETPVLEDVQFRSLGQSNSRWTTADKATAERGFFAFPAALAGQHELSGHTAHLSVKAGDGPLTIAQQLGEIPSSRQNLSVGAFVRGTKKSKVTLRLRDDEGVVCECSATTRNSNAWQLVRLDLGGCRDIAGLPTFEVEGSGKHITDLEVALTNSTEPDVEAAESYGSNLLSNPGLTQWPHGAGVLERSRSGEACTGWHVRNSRSDAPIYSRAVLDPSTGNIGLAVAAADVPRYLRIEGEFAASDLGDLPLVLRFKAGSPPAARQMLANEKDATPQFAIIDRVYVIRRTRLLSSESYSEGDEVIATFARKVSIRQQVEDFSYTIAPVEEGDEPEVEDGQTAEITYHLAFDFRHPTAVALFDVEVLQQELPEAADGASALKVEDRNIELQIETLETTAHWRGPTPVRLATDSGDAAPAPLKWEVSASRPPVTVVIPVFNALPETLACLESITGASTVPTLVRVIDDASDQTVREALVDYARGKPWLKVHSFAQNRGYTYAADYGIRAARTEWVVLLNSDTIVTRGWLEGMLDCAHSDPRIGFVGPLSNAASYQSVPELYDSAKKWKINRLPPGVTPEDVAEIVRRVSLRGHPHVPLLNGFCTLMKTATFVELGGLNPTAFPAGYGEENDLCLRAAKAGVKLAVADDVYVYHVKSASFGNARREELTKSGNAALKKLHPDVDIGALTAKFRETPALVAVRDGVASELSKLHAPREVGGAEDMPARPQPARPSKTKEPQLQRA